MTKKYLIKQNRTEHRDINHRYCGIDITCPLTSQHTITPHLSSDTDKIDHSLREGPALNEINTSFPGQAATCSSPPYAFPRDGSITPGNMPSLTGGISK